MKIFFFSFLVLIFYTNCYSQVKDTVYIYFDSTEVSMRKGSFKDKRVLRKNKTISSTYYINEKKHKYSYLTDSGYTFWHRNRSKRDLVKWDGKLPLKLIKDTCFLKTINLLDKKLFLETDFIKVCKIFEADDSRDQDVIIFIIDKEEIRDGKMILREVTFSRPVKE